jgi:hypothetical protein
MLPNSTHESQKVRRKWKASNIQTPLTPKPEENIEKMRNCSEK